MALNWAWSIVWFFVLILLAWWLGLLAALLFCFLSPFAACCNCTKVITDFIHKGVMLPYHVSVAMVQGKSCGEI